MATATTSSIQTYLGARADSLLGFKSPKISKDHLHLPGPGVLDRIWSVSDRNPRVLASLHRMFHTGRLSATGYLSILPVDQGVEPWAGARFAERPEYFGGWPTVTRAV